MKEIKIQPLSNTSVQACKKCGNDFTLDQDDFSFYEKMKVPAPKICPDCRFKIRALWRNETTLYSGKKCAFCQKAVVSMYNPKAPYTIICYDCFYSDKWNPKDFAMVYDKSRSFFDQIKDFLIKVPKMATYLSLANGKSINSEYANMASGCKNCYMVFNTGPGVEDILYSRGIVDSRDSSDLYFGEKTEQCYESINIHNSSGVSWGQNISSCVDSHFILNGSGLTNCFGCVNFRNKSNCYFNEQLSQVEYLKKINEIKGSFKKTEEEKNKFIEFCKTLPHRANNNLKTINSNGDYLFECKNIQASFEATASEDCKFVFSTKFLKDSIGVTGFGQKAEKLLECVGTGISSNIIGSYGVDNSRDVLYSFYSSNCQDCIGCDALRHGKYAILNKEYEKGEYEELKEHIVQELTEKDLHGLMMPPEIAPFAYNETIAQDNMPLTKEEALAQGFRWEDDIQMTKGKETIEPEEIPDHIKDVRDDILKEVLKCITCERNYKITESELLFYRKMILPIPRKCFFCRHRERIVRRGPFKFFTRNCSNCGKETYTNLTKEVAPIMYCEKCYQQEII